MAHEQVFNIITIFRVKVQDSGSSEVITGPAHSDRHRPQAVLTKDHFLSCGGRRVWSGFPEYNLFPARGHSVCYLIKRIKLWRWHVSSRFRPHLGHKASALLACCHRTIDCCESSRLRQKGNVIRRAYRERKAHWTMIIWFGFTGNVHKIVA